MSWAGGPHAIEAVVQAGTAESRYLRLGSGMRIVLLLPSRRDLWIGGPLLPKLAERFCVIVPELPIELQVAMHATRADRTLPAGPPLGMARWLFGFLDGMGIERCAIVAERELAGALCPIVYGDDRIERLAFIGHAVSCGPSGNRVVRAPCPAFTWTAPPDGRTDEPELLVRQLAAFLGGAEPEAGRLTVDACRG
jgi:hypothetical protein